MQKLTNNEYGFDVSKDNPFQIFRLLQYYAKESVGEENIIDLSRGDPGYGFTPSQSGREFLSYLIFLDSKLNNEEKRFLNRKHDTFEAIQTDIESITKENYSEKTANHLLETLKNFLEKLVEITNNSKVEILFEIFKYATVSGGTYHDPKGEKLAKQVIAYALNQIFKTPIQEHELTLTNGANHAIATCFKSLGEEGLGFIKRGDTVAIGSPVYSPYNAILESRGLNVVTFNIDFKTGEFDQESIDKLMQNGQRIKMLLIIDPNNPTGYGATNSQLQILAQIADKHDSIIVSDEVYQRFFIGKESILDHARKRTIRIGALTKIERSAGIRCGFYTLTDETNNYLTTQVLHDHMPEGKDLRQIMHFAKAPGYGTLGAFQHVTFVPAISQYLGVAHTILGEQEKLDYIKAVSGNMNAFTETLELPHKGNMYYIIFDLHTGDDTPIEKKLVDLAKLGVVYIPAFRFFAEHERQKNRDKYLHTARASVVNTSEDKVRKAAEITKKYLTNY